MEHGLDIRTFCITKLEMQRKEMLMVRKMSQPIVRNAISKRIAVLNETFNFADPILLNEVRPTKTPSAPIFMYQ
jgi:hypothetical protein